MNKLMALLLMVISALSCTLGCASVVRQQRGDFEITTFTYDSTNVYLVSQKKNLLMIDSGYEKNAEKLEQGIRDAGFDPSTISAIVLTHGHADHAGGARHFQQKFGTKIIAGAGDHKMLESGQNEALCPTGLIARYRLSTDQSAQFSPTAPGRQVEKSLSLKAMTGIDATITVVPGHTQGSLVVALGDVVFVGDLLRGSLIGSGAETHFYMCDIEGNRRDIKSVLNETAPQADLFFVGHFGPVSRLSVQKHFVNE